MKPRSEEKRFGLFAAVLGGAALLTAAWLAFVTVYSADDFWYSTFFDRDFPGYLELMRYHYQTFNGRILVHVAAQLLLRLGSWSFALACAGLLAWIPLSAALADRREPAQRLTAMSLFAVGVLAMPLAMLREGVFWLSAFCNYVLPTAMICTELLLLRRQRERGGFRPAVCALLCAYAFCCGATTEQSGVAAVLAPLYYFLTAPRRVRRERWAALLAAVCALGGVMTIFLSPATRSRVGIETGGAGPGLFPAMLRHFRQAADLFCGSWGPVALFALLLVMTGVLVGRKLDDRRPVWAGAALAAAALGAFLTGRGRFWLFLALFALLLASAVILLALRREIPALLLLAGVASVAVILPTNSIGGRTLLPFCLYLLASAALLAGQLLPPAPAPWRYGLPLAGAVLVGATLIPTVTGFWHNYTVDQLNKRYAAEAADSGVLWYCMDYDMRYTHEKPFHDGHFYQTYLDSLGLGEDTEVYLYSEKLPAVYAGGRRVGFPALPQEDGSLLLPLRGIVEALDGSVTLLDKTRLRVALGGRTYLLDYPDETTARLTWTAEDGTARALTAGKSVHYSSVCLGQALFSQGFGLEISREADGSVRVLP